MQPREAFGIVVRSLGMLLIAYALWNLGFAFSDAVSFTTKTGVPAPDYVTLIVTFTLMGLTFIRGANIIVNFAYPRSDKSEEVAAVKQAD